jgi:hypothetical protein
MSTYLGGVMKRPVPYDAMEAAAQRHAQLDKTTAVLWEEEAKVYSRLKMVDHKLQMLRKAAIWCKPKRTAQEKTPDQLLHRRV